MECRETQPVNLVRTLGFWGALSLVLGNVIGSGIFVTPGNVLKGSGSVAMSLAVWIVAGSISLMGGLAFSELGSMIPRSASEYSYQLNGLGSYPAFLFAGTFIFLVKPSSFSIGCQVFSSYILTLIIEPTHSDYGLWLKVSTILCILLHCSLAALSLRLASKLQMITTCTKITALLVIVAGGVFNLAQGNHGNFTQGFLTPVPSASDPSFESMSRAFFSATYAFNGWQVAGDLAEEIKNPKRNIPLALLIGIASILGLYILVNLSYLTVLTPDAIIQSPSVATVWAQQTMSQNLSASWARAITVVVAVTVALSSFGGTLSGTFSGVRLIFAAGRQGHLPRILSFLHKTTRTPLVSVLLNGTLALLVTLVGEYTVLINLSGFAVWFFLGLTMVSLLTMRVTRRDLTRPFKAWIIAPILVIGLALYLVIVPIIFDPSWMYLATLGYFAFLSMVYLVLIRSKSEANEENKEEDSMELNSWERRMATLLHVVPPQRVAKI